MTPKIETEIRVFPAGSGMFGWAVQVKTGNRADQPMVVGGMTSGFLTARFRATEFCRRLAEAALRPVVNGNEMELKAEDPSGADLSRARTT